MDVNLNKIILVLRNKLFSLNNEELVFKCLDNNLLISNLAIQELVRRNPTLIMVDDNFLEKVIWKMTIEQIWELAHFNVDTKLCFLASIRLRSILEYYDLYNQKEDRKEKIYLLK